MICDDLRRVPDARVRLAVSDKQHLIHPKPGSISLAVAIHGNTVRFNETKSVQQRVVDVGGSLCLFAIQMLDRSGDVTRRALQHLGR